MARSLSITLVLAGALAALGAGPYHARTTNFVVEGPSQQVVDQVAQYAEHYRKEKALQWLGREMPTWPAPCPIKVTVQMDGAGGATTFIYGPNGVEEQRMHIEGRYDRLLASVLPHEITHTVFAHYFRCAIPRWADEGGSVLSEDEPERNRHERITREVFNTPGRYIQLATLFRLHDYPDDVMSLYAEGYSVSNFLVSQGGDKGRQTFLNFVACGMRNDDWNGAVQRYYGYRNVNELERAWVDSVRRPRAAPAQLVQNTQPADVEPARRVVSRQTAPPLAVTLEAPRPLYRGQMGGDPDGPAPPPSPSQASRPSFPPDDQSRPAVPNVPAALAAGSAPPGTVTLGSPQVAPPPPPPVVLGAPVPVGTSPAGYPR
jgi:hypothetical protein